MANIEHHIIRRENIYFAPVIHGRLEFAEAVRQLFFHVKPDAVAVEFPPTIESAVLRGIDRLPYISVVLYEEKDGRHIYLPLEPQDPVVAAAYLARTNNVPLHFIDRDTEDYHRHREAWPDSYSVRRLGLAAYAEAYSQVVEGRESEHEDKLREMTMVWHLQNLAKDHDRILCVIGIAHYPPVRDLMSETLARPLGRTKRDGVTLANLEENSSREILSDMPFIAAEYMRSGEDASFDNIPEELDRLEIHRKLINQAKDKHQQNTKEEITRNQQAVLYKYARNYSFVQFRLTPDLFQLLVAARGAVDDNFAYEVWDAGTHYPWQEEDSQLPTLSLKGEDLYLDTKKIRFYRRFRQFRRRLVSVPIKKRRREKKPGEWKESWDGKYICSYPPEDIVVEGFGDYLKKKTLQILSEENRRIQPFETSMLDGIDMRETIRNWHNTGRIHVQENRRVQGQVGSVVLIFDVDDGEDEQYPWCMTWLGEHDQESDMAFYATPAGENVIGPGISRCEYGGFLMSYPPMRMYDIWKDQFFDGARNKAERLLLAGIDYSEEKLIAYIAAKPPADRMRSLAGMYGKKIIYLPIGQFSPVTLKKTRSLHVLDGHHVREWANDYIW